MSSSFLTFLHFSLFPWFWNIGKIDPLVVKLSQFQYFNVVFYWRSRFTHLKFGKDPTSGCCAILLYIFEVLFILTLYALQIGPVGICFEFVKDSTSGCWEIPLLILEVFKLRWPPLPATKNLEMNIVFILWSCSHSLFIPFVFVFAYPFPLCTTPTRDPFYFIAYFILGFFTLIIWYLTRYLPVGCFSSSGWTSIKLEFSSSYIVLSVHYWKFHTMAYLALKGMVFINQERA